MNKAKIRLSKVEADLVANAEWILTKNGIMQKAALLLGAIQEGQRDIIEAAHPLLPREVIAVSPKLSKGENYRGLPYLVLDYPRYFAGVDHFAIRTMFWWGHFFSITLQLSGTYKTKYAPMLSSSFKSLAGDGFYISTGEHEWEHHFEPANYRSIRELDGLIYDEYLQNGHFVKLAKQYPVGEWEHVIDWLLRDFAMLAKRLAG